MPTASSSQQVAPLVVLPQTVEVVDAIIHFLTTCPQKRQPPCLIGDLILSRATLPRPTAQNFVLLDPAHPHLTQERLISDPVAALREHGASAILIFARISQPERSVQLHFREDLDTPAAVTRTRPLIRAVLYQEAAQNALALAHTPTLPRNGEAFLAALDIRHWPHFAGICDIIWGTEDPIYDSFNLPSTVNLDDAPEVGDTVRSEGGDVYTVDTVREGDLEAITSYSTVHYQDAYLRKLVTDPSHVRLSRVLRDPQGVAVTWGMSHSNLQLAALSTRAEHRRKGLAKVVVRSLAKETRRFVEEMGVSGDVVGARASIAPKNVASRTLFEGMGYVKMDGIGLVWYGVKMKGMAASEEVDGKQEP
ncbi:hypothetical protein HK101_004757 [Irineochytrium annulatum]|nr:hypothetical protein HK101_004757 [Irineochytrium annulatum]